MHQLEFLIKDKDRLFYDRYEYSLSIYVPHIGLARSLNDRTIQVCIERWNSYRSSWNTSQRLSQEQQDILFQVAGHLRGLDSDTKKLFYQNWIYIYSNNRKELEELASKEHLTSSYAQQAVVSRPRDCLLMKQPTHKYRSYFRVYRMDNDNRLMLKNFFESRHEQYKCSPSLKRALKSGNIYLLDYFFVDYNNPQDMTMLNLVAPGCIRKTLSIQAK